MATQITTKYIFVYLRQLTKNPDQGGNSRAGPKNNIKLTIDIGDNYYFINK